MLDPRACFQQASWAPAQKPAEAGLPARLPAVPSAQKPNGQSPGQDCILLADFQIGLLVPSTSSGKGRLKIDQQDAILPH